MRRDVWFLPGPGFRISSPMPWMNHRALALITTGTVEYLYGGPPPTGDVMLTVFTTAAGFLAGLLTPSPVKPAPGGGEG